MKKFVLLTGLLLLAYATSALPKGKIRIEITPDRAGDWCYAVGDSVAYDVAVTLDGKPLRTLR